MNLITNNGEAIASITVLGNYDSTNPDSTPIPSTVWDGTALTELTLQGVEVDGTWTRWGYTPSFVIQPYQLTGLTKLTIKNLLVGRKPTDVNFIFDFTRVSNVELDHVIIDSNLAFYIRAYPTTALTFTDIEIAITTYYPGIGIGAIYCYFEGHTASLTVTNLNMHDNILPMGNTLMPVFGLELYSGTVTSTFTNVTFSNNQGPVQFLLQTDAGSLTSTIDGLTMTQNKVSNNLFALKCAVSNNCALTLKNVLLEDNQYNSNNYLMLFNSVSTNTQIEIDGLEMKNHAFDSVHNGIYLQPNGPAGGVFNFTLQNAAFTNLYTMSTVISSTSSASPAPIYLLKNIIFKNVIANNIVYLYNTPSWTIQNVTFEDYQGVAIGCSLQNTVTNVVVDQVRFLPYANTTNKPGLAFQQYIDTSTDTLTYTFKDITLSSLFQTNPIYLQNPHLITVNNEGALTIVVPTYYDLATYTGTDVTNVCYAESFPKFPKAYVNVQDTDDQCDVTDNQVLTPVTSGTTTFDSLGFAWAGQTCSQTLSTLDLTTLPQPINWVGNYEFTADQTLTMDTNTQVEQTTGCLVPNGTPLHVTVLADSPTSGTIDLVTSTCFAGTGFGTATVDIQNPGVCDAVVNVDTVAKKVTLTLTDDCPPPPTPETPPPGTQPPGTQSPGVPPPSDNPTGSPNAASQLVAAFVFLGLLCFL